VVYSGTNPVCFHEDTYNPQAPVLLLPPWKHAGLVFSRIGACEFWWWGMNWIKVRTNLVRDGRVVSLAIKLKSHPVFICGALCWLWACADEQTTDGKLHGYSPEYVDMQVNIPGFTMALTELTKDGKPSPWVIVTPEYVAVCEFGKHNGATAKKRAQSASRMSRKRYADSVTPAQRKAHLDKNREEKKTIDQNTQSKDTCPDPAAAGRVRPPAIGWDAASAWSGITDANRQVWAKAYPSVNIDGELAKAHAWLLSNPTRAGKRNWAKFLNGWMGRTHEGGSRGNQTGATRNGYQTPTAAAADRRRERAGREFEQTLDLPVVRFGPSGRVETGTDGYRENGNAQ
jgi:hypothetical protein